MHYYYPFQVSGFWEQVGQNRIVKTAGYVAIWNRNRISSTSLTKECVLAANDLLQHWAETSAGDDCVMNMVLPMYFGCLAFTFLVESFQMLCVGCE